MKVRFNGTQGFILALLIHVLVIGLLFFSIDTEKHVKPQPSEAEPKVMEAVVIDQGKIKAEAEKLKDAEEKKQAEQDKRKQEAIEAEKKRKEEEKKLEDLKQQQKEVEQKRQLEEENLKKVEQERLQQEKEKRIQEQKEAEEQARLEAEKLKQEEEAQAEEQRLIEEEAKQKAEEKRLQKEAEEEQKRKEEEARKKAEAEEKRKADEAQKLLEAEMAAEEAARGKEIAGSFYGKIAAQVERNFNLRGFKPGLKCVLEIKMVPGGDVVSVKVVESSGDARFDQAAERAAQKASPLPVPDDIKIFNQYLRTVRFRFNPG